VSARGTSAIAHDKALRKDRVREFANILRNFVKFVRTQSDNPDWREIVNWLLREILGREGWFQNYILGLLPSPSGRECGYGTIEKTDWKCWCGGGPRIARSGSGFVPDCPFHPGQMCGDLYLRGSESGSLRGSGEQASYPCKGEGREVGEGSRKQQRLPLQSHEKGGVRSC